MACIVMASCEKLRLEASCRETMYTYISAVQIRVLHDFPDAFDDLLEQRALDKLRLEHGHGLSACRSLEL